MVVMEALVSSKCMSCTVLFCF